MAQNLISFGGWYKPADGEVLLLNSAPPVAWSRGREILPQLKSEARLVRNCVGDGICKQR